MAQGPRVRAVTTDVGGPRSGLPHGPDADDAVVPSDLKPLTRKQRQLLDAGAAIRTERAERIDFLHTVQCQCGLPYRNPGDAVREWDRKQGFASLRIEAGSALSPQTREFVKLGLPYGEKPRLVLIHLPETPSSTWRTR